MTLGDLASLEVNCVETRLRPKSVPKYLLSLMSWRKKRYLRLEQDCEWVNWDDVLEQDRDWKAALNLESDVLWKFKLSATEDQLPTQKESISFISGSSLQSDSEVKLSLIHISEPTRPY